MSENLTRQFEMLVENIWNLNILVNLSSLKGDNTLEMYDVGQVYGILVTDSLSMILEHPSIFKLE